METYDLARQSMGRLCVGGTETIVKNQNSPSNTNDLDENHGIVVPKGPLDSTTR